MKIGFFSGSKKSQILILVLVVMAVILTLGVGLLIHSRSFRSASRIQVDAYKANCLAKSGINIGESFIDIDPCNPAVITMDETYSLGEGTIDVEIASTLANNVLSGTITSTGSSGKSTRVLEKTFNLPAPEPETWAKTYGTVNQDILSSLQKTSDGGYIMGGRTEASTKWMVIKTDASGIIEWAKTYGDGNSLDLIQQTPDGGYILGGEFYGGTKFDLMVIKTDSLGTVEWARTYGDVDSDFFNTLQQTPDGGYILGGTTPTFGAGGRDILLIKINSSGETIEWAKTYGGTLADYVGDIKQISNGYILGGFTKSFGVAGGSRDIMVIQTDFLGTVEWARTYDSATSNDSVSSLYQASDGGYILGGWIESDLLMIKIDSLGAFNWAKVYDGGNSETGPYLQKISGGYVLGGNSSYPGSGWDFFLVKTDMEGNVGPAYPETWARAYGDPDSISEEGFARSFQEISDGYIFGGCTQLMGVAGNFDFLVIKVDSSGNLDCCNIVRDVIGELSVSEPSYTSKEHGVDFTLTTKEHGVDFTLQILQTYSNDGNPANDNFTITESDITGTIAPPNFVCPVPK